MITLTAETLPTITLTAGDAFLKITLGGAIPGTSGAIADVVTDGANGLAPDIDGADDSSVLVFDGATNPVWRQLTLDDILPAFEATLSGGTTVEVGATVTHPAFTATYTDLPNSATLADTDNPTPVALSTPFASFASTHAFTKTTNGATVDFTLSATKGSVTDTDVETITWLPRVFYGVGSGVDTEAEVEALATSALAASRARTFTVAPGSGEYIYYAYPASYGAATFTVGGFEGGFDLVTATLSVTNANGVTQNYRLYRSTNPNLGSTTVVVS